MFDPSCDFLLDMQPNNLFEETGTPHEVRCKGCRKTLKRWERVGHHARHLAGRTRSRRAAERRLHAQRLANLAKARAARRAERAA